MVLYLTSCTLRSFTKLYYLVGSRRRRSSEKTKNRFVNKWKNQGEQKCSQAPPKKYPLFAPHKNSFLCDNCDSPPHGRPLLAAAMNSVIFLPFFCLVGENQHPLQAAAVTAEFNPCFPGSLLIHLGRLVAVAVGSCTSTTTYWHYGPQTSTLFKHVAQWT